MKNKKLTIHKKNEIIRGTDQLSIYGKRLLNTIYYIIQKNDLYNYKSIIINNRDLKKFLNLEKKKDYTNIIRKTIKELQEKKIELYNYYNHEDKTFYKWIPIYFLQYPSGEIKEGKEIKYKITINPLILHLIKQKSNFTKLEFIPYTLNFRSKYNYKLYEFLKSFGNYKYIKIHLNYLNKLLNTNKKYPSKMRELLDRNIKELKEKTDLKDLEIEYLGDKVFKITINNKNKRTPPPQGILNDIINKITKKF